MVFTATSAGTVELLMFIAPSFSLYNNCRDNDHMQQKSARWLPYSFQKLDQRPKLLFAQMPQLLSVEFLDRPVQVPEKFPACLVDARDDHTPVAAFAAAYYQPAALQPVQQASDVGIAVDHTLRN